MARVSVYVASASFAAHTRIHRVLYSCPYRTCARHRSSSAPLFAIVPVRGDDDRGRTDGMTGADVNERSMEARMSRRNGDRARFQINRKRKLRHRQRVRALVAARSERRESQAAKGQDGRSPKERPA